MLARVAFGSGMAITATTGDITIAMEVDVAESYAKLASIRAS
jgi:hypothetical protein